MLGYFVVSIVHRTLTWTTGRSVWIAAHQSQALRPVTWNLKRPTVSKDSTTTRTYTDFKVFGTSAATAKQLVYSTTCSFDSCPEQGHKDRVQRTNCWELQLSSKTIRLASVRAQPAPSEPQSFPGFCGGTGVACCVHVKTVWPAVFFF